ncbi:hypothetical protein ACJA88_013780 [Fusarium oxysporum]
MSTHDASPQLLKVDAMPSEKELCGPATDTRRDSDVENIAGTVVESNELRQGLHQRHIQMIALAGTIGTGLFLSSGRAIAYAGPLGAFLAYLIIGLAVSSVVCGVGEMGALAPLSGGVIRYAELFCDPALAFANGWNQVYSYMVSIPAEIVAAAVIIEYWLEFGFSIIKIMLIVGVNIMALVITCGGGPKGEAIGFEYWKSPYGPMVQYLGIAGSLGRFLGFWKTLNNALYAYSGIENITLAAAETRNPRQSIPMAARRILIRIALFYVVTIFMIGLVVPSTDKKLVPWTGDASMSPFVIAAQNAGIKVVPSIVNAVVLTSAWSAGNSNMLGGSRILYGMASQGQAPSIFLRINRFGIPYVAVSLYGLFMALGYMTLSDSASTVFTWLQDLVSISTLVNWITICIVYLRFVHACNRQGINRQKELPWAAPFQPYTTYASLVLFVLLFFTGGFTTFIHGQWEIESFISNYFNLPFTLIMYFGYKLWFKTKVIPLEDVELRHLIDRYENEPRVEPKPRRGLARLNFLWS